MSFENVNFHLVLPKVLHVRRTVRLRRVTEHRIYLSEVFKIAIIDQNSKYPIINTFFIVLEILQSNIVNFEEKVYPKWLSSESYIQVSWISWKQESREAYSTAVKLSLVSLRKLTRSGHATINIYTDTDININLDWLV